MLNTVTDGEDYRRNATLNIPANITSTSFTINIINDNISECNKLFKIVLSVPPSTCGVIVGNNNTSEVTINDDDGKR